MAGRTDNPHPRPTFKASSEKGRMLRDMNRDLLMGLLLPGPDRFEVRGWVRLLFGNPDHVRPTDPADVPRLRALEGLDDDGLMHVHDRAYETVVGRRAPQGTATYRRGWTAHDGLMAYLLSDAVNPEPIRHALEMRDHHVLLDVLHIPDEDAENEDFLRGFHDANVSLAQLAKAELNKMAD